MRWHLDFLRLKGTVGALQHLLYPQLLSGLLCCDVDRSVRIVEISHRKRLVRDDAHRLILADDGALLRQ